MTCPNDDELALAALGELELAHDCPSCREKFDRFKRVTAAVRDRFESHPADDELALAALGEAALDHECPDCAAKLEGYARTVSRVRGAYARRRTRWWPWMSAAAAAAVALVAVWPHAPPPIQIPSHPKSIAVHPVSINGMRVEIDEPDLHIVWIFEE